MTASSLPPEWIAAAFVVFGLAAIAKVADSITSVFSRFRRRPPIDQELLNYVRHPDLIAAKAELRSEISRIEGNARDTFAEAFNAMRSLQSSTQQSFQDLTKTIGRLEGILERCPDLCRKGGPR